ncbi:MAG: hypothetical protein AAF357_12715 [Verrucomicrobiota bacterium]
MVRVSGFHAATFHLIVEHTMKRMGIYIALGISLPAFLILAVSLLASLAGYYLRSIGSPHDPAEHGFTPAEVVSEAAGGFVMNRYRIKAHWFARYFGGNPHQRTDGGYDTIIVITDLSGKMIARISHWNGNPTVVVTPEGITTTDGIEWKAAP